MDLIDRDALLGKLRAVMKEPQYQHDGEDWLAGLLIAEDLIQSADAVANREKEKERKEYRKETVNDKFEQKNGRMEKRF